MTYTVSYYFGTKDDPMMGKFEQHFEAANDVEAVALAWSKFEEFERIDVPVKDAWVEAHDDGIWHIKENGKMS